MAALLQVSGLVKRFGGVIALDGVDLELGEREILGLIGPNGSGKSTLVNCVSGVLSVSGGRVFLSGRDITSRPARLRARAGMTRTFQNLRLFGGLTVTENVLVGLFGRRVRRNVGHVEELLERLRLTEVRGAAVAGLPYGHLRRVELARALAARPAVLLLDEPAAGLNDGETAELLEIVRQIRADLGCGVLLIDHDMSLVMNASDRVVVLDEGRVLFEGLPSAVFSEQVVVEAYLGADA